MIYTLGNQNSLVMLSKEFGKIARYKVNTEISIAHIYTNRFLKDKE